MHAPPPEDAPGSSSSAAAAGVPAFAEALKISRDKTRLLRFLSALLLAYCMRFGVLQLEQLRLAPIPALVLAHMLLVVSAAQLMGGSWRAEARAAAAAGGGGEVPVRLRQKDWLALVPGLRPLVTVVGTWLSLLSSVWDDAAVYAVAFLLLSLLP
jgi:hypothetical protein